MAELRKNDQNKRAKKMTVINLEQHKAQKEKRRMDSQKRRAALLKVVQPHWDIPDALLDEIANLPEFSIRYVRKAAKSRSQRYPREMFDYRKLAHALRESANQQSNLMLSGEYELSVFVVGGILENYMVADALETMAEPSRER